MKSRLGAVVLVVCLGVVGCGGPSPQVGGSTPEPTGTARPAPRPTKTPRFRPTPLKAPTRQPTSPAPKTSTPEPTQDINATFIPTWEINPTNTLAPITGEASPTPDFTLLGSYTVRTSVSPDGVWTATLRWSSATSPELPDAFSAVTVSRTDGTQEWPVLSMWEPDEPGAVRPEPLRWSADGRYFYYTMLDRYYEPCRPWFNNAYDLIRVDLADGTVTEIIPHHQVGVVSFSPDDTQVAMIGPGLNVIIMDLNTGKSYGRPIIEKPSLEDIGAIVWSPDAMTLALTVATPFCPFESDPTSLNSIYTVDVKTLEAKRLVFEDDRMMVTTGWTSDGIIQATDASGATWLIDPETGDVSPAPN